MAKEKGCQLTKVTFFGQGCPAAVLKGEYYGRLANRISVFIR